MNQPRGDERLSVLIERLRRERARAIIAIDGGTALGKSTLARQLGTQLDATVPGTDSYVVPRHERTTTPFNPDTFRLKELTRDIRRLQDGMTLWLGEYNHRKKWIVSSPFSYAAGSAWIRSMRNTP